MQPGYRKAALYLSSLAPTDRRALLAAMPAVAVRQLTPLIDEVTAKGWSDPESVRQALAGEILGLTTHSSLSIDALVALGKALPANWTARVFAANVALDAGFLVALLDKPASRQVQDQLLRVPRLPERLKDALLAEAGNSIRLSA